jgi:hypothetical protein
MEKAYRRRIYVAAFLLAYALMAYYYAELRWAFCHVHLSGAFYSIMDGSANNPHQYRLLVPWLLKFIVNAEYKLPFIKSVSHLFFISEAVFTFLLIIAFRYYLSLTLKSSIQSYLFAFFLLFSMNYTFLYSRAEIPFVETFLPYESITDYYARYYPYDTPSMLFMILGLIMLYRRQMVPYYIIFAVSTFNKESSIFLAFVFLFSCMGRGRKRFAALHFMMQAGIWVAIKYYLYDLYSGNMGSFVELCLMANIEYLTTPSYYPHLISAAGVLWFPALVWRRLVKDDFVRRALFVLIPFAAWIMFFEDMRELRIYGDVIPVLLPAAFLAVRERLGITGAWPSALGEGGSAVSGVQQVKQPASGRIVYYLVFILLVGSMSYYYAELEWTYSRIFRPGGFLEIMNDEASRPFQYRVLTPKLAGFIFSIIKVPFIDSVYEMFFAIEVLALFLFVLVFRRYLSLTLKDDVSSFLLSFTLFFVMPFNFLAPRYDILSVNYSMPNLRFFPDSYSLFYPYDTPSLLFFTLGIIFIYKRRWIPYYILFAIGTLNRETTCFLAFIYLFVTIGKESKQKIAIHCLAQFIVWMAIKYSLYKVYAGNPGQPFQGGVALNMGLLTTPSLYHYMFSNLGYLWIPTLIFFGCIGNDFLRRSLLVVFPFLFGNFLIGQFVELRGFGELIPVLMPAFAVLFLKSIKGHGAREESGPS